MTAVVPHYLEYPLDKMADEAENPKALLSFFVGTFARAPCPKLKIKKVLEVFFSTGFGKPSQSGSVKTRQGGASTLGCYANLSLPVDDSREKQPWLVEESHDNMDNRTWNGINMY